MNIIFESHDFGQFQFCKKPVRVNIKCPALNHLMINKTSVKKAFDRITMYVRGISLQKIFKIIH